MKKNHLFIASATLLSITTISSFVPTASVFADDKTLNTTADVTFKEDSSTTDPVDPTDPTNPINPVDPVQPTVGPLSIDYASSFHFGEQKISAKDETYYAKLVEVTDSTGTAAKRQNWVQVTDKRGTNVGWKLQVQQETQLTTGSDADAKELKGAEIKIMNTTVKTTNDNQSTAPTSPQEITLIPGTSGSPGAAQEVMTAQQDQGMGTWVDGFGDETTGDKSVSLTVPGVSEKVKDGNYSTNLIWLLSDTAI
jgi:hypothetical protein